MMIAAREIDTRKTSRSSRNWINEKLIYTHGYGVTMNTANGFTPEGMPRFVVSNMPIKSTSPRSNSRGRRFITDRKPIPMFM